MEGKLKGWPEEVLTDERWAEEGWAEEPPGQEEIRPPKLITRSRCPVKPHAERVSACRTFSPTSRLLELLEGRQHLGRMGRDVPT